MSSLILFVVGVVFCFSALAQQQTLYMQPGRPGHFTTTPVPKNGPTRSGPWDGGVMIVPGAGQARMNVPSNVGSTSSASSPSSAKAKPSSNSSRGSRAGVGLENDIRGGYELGRTIAAEQAYQAYVQWLDASTAQINKFYKSQPRISRQLQSAGYVPKAEAVLSPDEEQLADYTASGEGLVMIEPLDRGGAANLLRSMGIGVATSTSEEEAAFSDVYEQFRLQEIYYHRQLVSEGRSSTLNLGRETGENVRAAERATQEVVQMNSEFSARDVPPPSIPEQFVKQVERVNDKIDRIEMTSPQATDFKSVAQSAYSESLDSMGRGENDDAKWYLDVAEGLADAAVTVADLGVGIDPVSGFYRSLIESVTGHNLITQEKLSTFERSLAVFGVLSVGSSSSVQAVVRLASRLGAEVKFAQRVIQAAKVSGQNLGKVVEAMLEIGRYGRESGKFRNKDKILTEMTEAITKSHSEIFIEKIRTADHANLKHLLQHPEDLPPFHAHNYIVEGRLRVGMNFGRVSEHADNLTKNASGPLGTWIFWSKNVDISRMTPTEIQRMFSLPRPPRFITEGHAPAGTLIEKSYTSTAFGGSGGTVQYRLKEIESKWFGAPRELK